MKIYVYVNGKILDVTNDLDLALKEIKKECLYDQEKVISIEVNTL